MATFFRTFAQWVDDGLARVGLDDAAVSRRRGWLWPLLAVLGVVCAGLDAAVVAAPGRARCPDPYVDPLLSGTAGEWQRVTGACPAGPLRTSLALGLPVTLLSGLTLTLILLLAGRRRWRSDSSTRLCLAGALAAALATGTALLTDLLDLVLAGTSWGGPPPTLAVWVVACLGWTTAVLVAAALLGVLYAVISGSGHRGVERSASATTAAATAAAATAAAAVSAAAASTTPVDAGPDHGGAEHDDQEHDEQDVDGPGADPSGPGAAGTSPAGELLGICSSGGGLRAAGYTVGILQGFEATGLLSKARYLASVSGGGYTVGAWWLARASAARPFGTGEPASGAEPSDAGSALTAFVTARRHYLSWGRGGVLAQGILAVLALVWHWLVLYTLIWVSVRPLGWLASSAALAPWLRHGDPAASNRPASQALPSGAYTPALILVLALVLLGFALVVRAPGNSSWLAAAGATAALAGVVLVVTAGIPLLVAEVPRLWSDIVTRLPGSGATASGTASSTKVSFVSGVVQLLTLVGVTGFVTRTLQKQAESVAPRAGGVLVSLLALWVAGEVMTDAAYLGPGRSPASAGHPALYADLWSSLLAGRSDLTAWLLLVAGLAVTWYVFDVGYWSLHRIYWGGLRHTFAPTHTMTDRASGSIEQDGWYPLSRQVEVERYHFARDPAWEVGPNGSSPAPPGSTPEVLICAAVQRRGRDITGIPAASFVFSRSGIGWHAPGPDGEACVVPAQLFSDAIPQRQRDHGYATVSRAVAISGAAVSSANGRIRLGTTNALLAAVNLRLGVWLPNPAKIAAEPAADSPGGGRSRSFTRPRLGFLLKEVFGQFDLAGDSHVYVTDGGHWDNLGFVELVRRRCSVILAADAGQDAPFSARGIQDAINLAWQECRARVSVPDLADLATQEQPSGLARANVVSGTIEYLDAQGRVTATGIVVFGKLQVAVDSSPEVRAFNEIDTTFPRIATFDLFVQADQFEHLRLLGAEIATRMAERLAQLRPPPPR